MGRGLRGDQSQQRRSQSHHPGGGRLAQTKRKEHEHCLVCVVALCRWRHHRRVFLGHDSVHPPPSAAARRDGARRRHGAGRGRHGAPAEQDRGGGVDAALLRQDGAGPEGVPRLHAASVVRTRPRPLVAVCVARLRGVVDVAAQPSAPSCRQQQQLLQRYHDQWREWREHQQSPSEPTTARLDQRAARWRRPAHGEASRDSAPPLQLILHHDIDRTAAGEARVEPPPRADECVPKFCLHVPHHDRHRPRCCCSLRSRPHRGVVERIQAVPDARVRRVRSGAGAPRRPAARGARAHPHRRDGRQRAGGLPRHGARAQPRCRG
eukprot:PhM_4_TR14619/c0_g1_i5/m.84343